MAFLGGEGSSVFSSTVHYSRVSGFRGDGGWLS